LIFASCSTDLNRNRTSRSGRFGLADSVWLIRSGRFGLSRFGLSRFGLAVSVRLWNLAEILQ